MFEPDTIAIVAIAFLIAGIVKGTIGLGLPIISIAILAATVGLKSAVALFLVPAMATNCWQAFTGGHFTELLRRLWPMFATAIVGIWVGVQILASADARVLSIALGIVLVVYATIALLRAKMPSPGTWEPWMTPVVGVAGGVMFGVMGNFLVPGVLYIQALGLPRDMFVQALGMTFLIISTTLALLLSRYSLMPTETLAMSAAALVPTAVGMYIGQRLRSSLSEAQFAKAVLVAIGLAGVFMIVRAMSG